MREKFYLTTAIPYVNAPPHVGHALEFTQADAVARYQRLLGKEVFLTTGADENALKNVQAAEKLKISPLALCTKNFKKFQKLAELLNIKFSVWRRGSDKKLHFPGVQKLWRLCQKGGDIYKKPYRGLYCVGCEAFLTEKELVEGLCPYHQKKPEVVEEENYFFRLSKYQPLVKKLIEEGRLKIIPETRKNEILSFIQMGLEDFSISRSKKRARGWGVPVPGDPEQIVYVWFDALTIYMTGVGWGYNVSLWQRWWPADLHIIGKDIIRFHAVYWPAMLLSAGLPLPKTIFVHGFITSGGRKMSKSLGNIVDPFYLVKKFGADAVRYFFLKEIPAYEDGDLTPGHFKEVYNADLANGLGNLVARVAKLCEKAGFSLPNSNFKPKITDLRFRKFQQAMGKYKFNEALLFIFRKVSQCDKFIDQTKPWELLKYRGCPFSCSKIEEVLEKLVKEILETAVLLEPFMPQTSQKIKEQFQGKIKSERPLFPRAR